jgi:hypothetical protein
MYRRGFSAEDTRQDKLPGRSDSDLCRRFKGHWGVHVAVGRALQRGEARLKNFD